MTVYVTTPLRWGIHVPYNSDIQTVKQLENQTFAISREGSGSHLMTYVRAKQEGWNLKDLKFNVVGDVYGGLWALENNQAQGFLWEKYTTYPFTEQKKCRYIDEVVTPWPCFVIAVRSELLQENEALLKTVFERVHQEAKALKENPNAAEIIAWRYNLKLEQTKSWLSETDWNYDNSLMKDSIEKVVNTLESLDLISADEKENWEEKVF